ncbi:ABC transporter substrate-binding protein [Shouchella clausii]|uniref:extracellular solute-binding protein n=1 Tax=Shouchella TaxID=2893057 RepID=UPI00090F9DE0|nr:MULTISPECIES: extracellular solute-binding protein [Shouchella]MBU8595690.1 extracellular solute-binding protein [Shouchella clausii]MBX0318772.1 extracellular solute-binding protein [Shouchella clausii]MCM3381746.1 extracellular solute-binding protein [Shouchella rhizosphaerae]MDO7284003.1 extracellular solute-binding protein [Shouchella clausii]MDO7304099.1 extracellular solute-binding protein [Shouchella clausii]
MRTMFDKKVAVVLCSLLTLAACNNNASDPVDTNESNDPDEPLYIKMFAGLYNELPEMDNAYWTEWQERTNTELDIEWVPSGDLDTKMDLLLASGDLPEVLSSPDVRPPLVNAIKNGAFWELDDFLGDYSEYPNLKNNLAEDWQKYLSVDGKLYGLPRSRSRIDIGIKIRKDWLDELNIPVPTTLDEYQDALKQIVEEDPAGSDTLGLIGHGTIVADGTDAFAAAFGAMDPYFTDDGGLVPKQLTPMYTDMVEWFSELYADGLLAQEFSVMKLTQAEELYKSGRAASYARSIWWDKEYEDAISRTQPDPEIINLALEGPGGVSVNLATGVSGGYFISKTVPEEKVKKILDYLEHTASEEITELAYYGIEGVHHEVVDGQKVLNELGEQEINTTSKGAGVLAYSKWGKVESASGSKEYNDNKKQQVEHFDEIGTIDPMTGLHSDIWLTEWAKHVNEWETMVTRVIVGQISIDEYKDYIESIKESPGMLEAFAELGEEYKVFNQ